MKSVREAAVEAKIVTFIEHQAEQNLRVAKALEDIATLIDIVNDKVNSLKN
tara:strand:- start:2823 stop:2975 length:153 start_codon:yes stop_codon:yes gene_type:complete